MKRIGRRPFLVGAALAAACRGEDVDTEKLGTSSAPHGPSPVFPEGGFGGLDGALPEPRTCVDRDPSTPLVALTGVLARGPFPATVYSWTSDEQADALREGASLFTKATTDDGHRGHLFDMLEERVARGDAVAGMLAGPTFTLGRFAWPFPAGTRVSPERYGDSLVAIELRPEALVVAIRATHPGFYEVRDLGGNEVRDALAQPDRIGAFFFTNDASHSAGTFGPHCTRATTTTPLLYRELYLGNAAMVKRFSLSTPEIHARLESEERDLRSLARSLDCSAAPLGGCADIVREWYLSTPTRVAGFLRSLAFANPFGTVHGFDGPRLAALADDVARIPRSGLPFVAAP